MLQAALSTQHVVLTGVEQPVSTFSRAAGIAAPSPPLQLAPGSEANPDMLFAFGTL